MAMMAERSTRSMQPFLEGGLVLVMLRTQAAMYARLEECARRQRDLVSADDAAPLLAVLAARQKLSTELSELGAKLAPYRRNWEVFRGALDEQERREVDRLVAETAACLRRVMEGDEQDVRLLSARRQLTVREMQSTRAGGTAIAAYRPTAAAMAGRCLRFDEAT